MAVGDALPEVRLGGRELQRQCQACGGPAGMNHTVRLAACGGRGGECDAERAGHRRPAGLEIDEFHSAARDPAEQPGCQAADHTRPDDPDFVTDQWRCVPGAVERGLHVGRQYRATRRDIVR